MDKTVIKNIAESVHSKTDLLIALNAIKKMEMEEQGIGELCKQFSIRHINYYCNPNHTANRYTQFEIPKKSGGKRTICAPKSKNFKLILHCLNILLRSLYIPNENAMGFAEGRCIADNASVHVGQNYVFNIDLKDFFTSVDQARVWKRLQLRPFNFEPQLCNVIAGLCCMKISENGKTRYVLPQGAPTSPIITNMICDQLDQKLSKLAKHFGLNYSRYADDITFSSMHNVYDPKGKFRKQLQTIIEKHHFTINEAKTRLQKKGARQEVTGIIVSDKINVSQKYIRNIRNLLYIWDRYGYNEAYFRFSPKYKSEKGHVKKGVPDMINVVEGKLLYLKMVKGEDDSVYVRLNEKFCYLVNKARNITQTNHNNITYVETLNVLDFEKKYNTVIKEITTQNKKRKVVFEINGEQISDTSITLEVQKRFETIEANKDKLAISTCRDAKDKQFWLIHKQGMVTVKPQQPVNIDELNNDLDSLLANI